MAALALILALCAISVGMLGVSGDEHVTYNVGDTNGWTLPSVVPGGYNYTNWAANKSFHDGDTLFFRYTAPRHAVLEVSEPDYNACNFSRPLRSDNQTGNSNITFNRVGDFYFVCPVGNHCVAGMKFKATASADVAPPPSAAFLVASAGMGTAAAVLGMIGYLVL